MSILQNWKDLNDIPPKYWQAFATKVGAALEEKMSLLQVVIGVIQGRLKVTVEIIRRLGDLVSVTVPEWRGKLHDFLSQDGIWCSHEFLDLLARASKGKVTVGGEQIAYATLEMKANDNDIEQEMPKEYRFKDVTKMFGFIAALINAQWRKDERGVIKGVLPTNDYHAAIFTLEVQNDDGTTDVFAVRVHWNADYREWSCYASRPDAYRWLAGYRAFSATDTQD